MNLLNVVLVAVTAYVFGYGNPYSPHVAIAITGGFGLVGLAHQWAEAPSQMPSLLELAAYAAAIIVGSFMGARYARRKLDRR